MPDIAMCANHECERKETCYRHTAIPAYVGQCYGEFNHEGCKYYWPVDTEDDEQ